ncbi:hypothetical protein DPMN_136575 [Dreissena polymorpha]|uniref:Uncharacterized protein n=1 Tax=Dreissena polymorpha TaxID=45954 RepID=A0A9D4JHZ0_DREPO|nr:hypothetical protein DPMN_136575 [Dreissena polymorpha]
MSLWKIKRIEDFVLFSGCTKRFYLLALSLFQYKSPFPLNTSTTATLNTHGLMSLLTGLLTRLSEIVEPESNQVPMR